MSVCKIKYTGNSLQTDRNNIVLSCMSVHQKFLRAHSEPRVKRLAKPVEAVDQQISYNANESDISDDER